MIFNHIMSHAVWTIALYTYCCLLYVTRLPSYIGPIASGRFPISFISYIAKISISFKFSGAHASYISKRLSGESLMYIKLYNATCRWAFLGLYVNWLTNLTAKAIYDSKSNIWFNDRKIDDLLRHILKELSSLKYLSPSNFTT